MGKRGRFEVFKNFILIARNASGGPPEGASCCSATSLVGCQLMYVPHDVKDRGTYLVHYDSMCALLEYYYVLEY
jgi:hypothetical protein